MWTPNLHQYFCFQASINFITSQDDSKSVSTSTMRPSYSVPVHCRAHRACLFLLCVLNSSPASLHCWLLFCLQFSAMPQVCTNAPHLKYHKLENLMRLFLQLLFLFTLAAFTHVFSWLSQFLLLFSLVLDVFLISIQHATVMTSRSKLRLLSPLLCLHFQLQP